MANSVEIQLQKAIEMKETVQDFSKILIQKMDDLNDMREYYVRAGFPTDIADTYRDYYYVPDRKIIEALSKDMMTRHVDFLDRVIAQLTEAKNQK